MKITSTPTHRAILPFDYATYVNKFIATYSQEGNIVLEKTEADIGKGVTIEGNAIIIDLTQDETKLFARGQFAFEVKLYTANKKVAISDKKYFTAEDVLNERTFV